MNKFNVTSLLFFGMNIVFVFYNQFVLEVGPIGIFSYFILNVILIEFYSFQSIEYSGFPKISQIVVILGSLVAPSLFAILFSYLIIYFFTETGRVFHEEHQPFKSVLIYWITLLAVLFAMYAKRVSNNS